MKNNFVNINKDFKPEQNFWQLNPQIQYIEPFNKLYNLDNGKTQSSSMMWACFFYCDPDEDYNKFFRLSLTKRKEAILRYYEHLDWENELFQECLEAYPFECLNSIQRSLKEELETLKERSRLLRDTPYILDGYMTNEEGDYILDKSDKPIFLKGNATQLDKMRKETDTIYSQIEKALDRFVKSKEESARVYGGRQETIGEKGLIVLVPFILFTQLLSLIL